MVTFTRATEKVTGFLAAPRDTRRHRAIIVIHEWWGLNEWVKEQAEKLAANGYVALAVDLYQGKVTTDPSEARKLKRCLRQEHAIGDLKAAFAYQQGSSTRGCRRRVVSHARILQARKANKSLWFIGSCFWQMAILWMPVAFTHTESF